MTLTVENGTGVTDADALCGVADADEYHEARGNVAAWNALDTDDKEPLLRRGYDYMHAMFSARWPAGVPFGVVDGAVPRAIRHANALLALKAKGSDLMPEVTPQKIEKTIGPLTTKFAPMDAAVRTFPDVERLVAPYLVAHNPYMARLERN